MFTHTANKSDGKFLFFFFVGAVFPAFALVFGQLFNIFVTQTPDEIRNSSQIIAAIFVAVGVYNLVFTYFAHLFWGLVGEAVGLYYRRQYFRSILRQEVQFFEVEGSTGSLIQTLNVDIENLENGAGTKVTTLFSNFGQVIVGLVIAFVFSWKLTLVLISITPLVAAGAIIQSKVTAMGIASQAEKYKQATSLAIEVISGFRTVSSFVWEEQAQALFFEKLAANKKSRRCNLNITAAFLGFNLFIVFAVYALGFWYGAQLIALGPANGGILLGDMLIVFFSVVMAAVGMSQALSVFPDFAKVSQES